MPTLTAVFKRDGDWWVGHVEEIPGATTQGETLEEARENLREAVLLIIESNREKIQALTVGKDVIIELMDISVADLDL